MGSIYSKVIISNPNSPGSKITCKSLVDTGASYLVLPDAWRKDLGNLDCLRQVQVQLGNQSIASGNVYGPVKIEIEGFSTIYGEALFIQMEQHMGDYEPLLGCIPLEQAQAAVDMNTHRLCKVPFVRV